MIIEREYSNQFYNDAQELFKKDWEETTNDGFPLEIDLETYLEYEKRGLILMITAREDEKLAGYIGFMSSDSMHHKKKIANCFGLYVSKEYRGITGSLLLKKAIEITKSSGFAKIRVSSSVKNDIGRFLARYGFGQEETIYGLNLIDFEVTP